MFKSKVSTRSSESSQKALILISMSSRGVPYIQIMYDISVDESLEVLGIESYL